MDFFCQRCGKSLEIDESLLRIDLPMGDLARGDIDLDRVFASRNSTTYSHNSLNLKNIGNRYSTYSASYANTSSTTFERPASSKNALSVSSSFILPRKGPTQTESPIPKNLPSHFNNRPSKTSTILLKADKPTPLSASNIFSSSTPSSSSSSSATPPSPSSSASSTNPQPTTPKTASPPNYPHFPHHPPPTTPSHPSTSSLYTTQSTPPNQSTNVGNPLPSPVGPTPQNPFPMQKSKSEFFRPNPNLSNSVMNTSSNSRLLNSSAELSQSQTISRSGMSQSFMAAYGSSMGSLKYIREGSRMNIRQPEVPHLSSTPSSHSMSLADAQAASKLFQLVSEQIGMDLPVCSECTKTLTVDLDDELSMTDAQNSAYVYYLEGLEAKEKGWAPLSELEEEIMKLEQEERELRIEISSLHEQKRQVKGEVDRLKNEAEKLVHFEERYWLNFDELHAALSNFVDDRDACKVQTATTRELLKHAQRTQIINDAFHIWHDGHFGTVNSFRLGRLPSQPVDWNEINAAWGLATLLLYNMSRRIDFKFSSYRLVPSGSCSKMEKLDNSSTYELFGSSDISLGRLFWYRRFDNGMVAFLNCLKEMGDYAESKDKSFKLPHRMEKDKVGDMSIKIQFNNEETWTKSLKYTLTNLKWLLAWVVRMEAEQTAANHGRSLSSLSPSSPSIASSSPSLSSSLPSSLSSSPAKLDLNNNNNAGGTSNMPATVNNSYSINNNNNNANNQAPRSRLTMLFSRANSSVQQ